MGNVAAGGGDDGVVRFASQHVDDAARLVAFPARVGEERTGRGHDDERHLREERRLDFFADRLAVTPARLNAACRRRLRTTASGLLHDRIVTEAKPCLIYTAMPVDAIGYALGFDDPAYFSRFFAKRTGQAPGRLRESLGDPLRRDLAPGHSSTK